MTSKEIDWRRLAEPQQDGYDSKVTLCLATEAGYQRPGTNDGPSFLEGAVSLVRDPLVQFPEGCVPVGPSHRNVGRAESLLRLWPEVYEQCRCLLDRLTLFRHQADDVDFVIGSICGPGTRGFGSIAVTVDHHVGFAEGIVHEMAHHKLQALGVEFESAKRLLMNDPSIKYPSPIRYDCLRPMSAVLHAQYSYTYIVQLDLTILDARQDRERDHSVVAHSLAVIAPKLEFGNEVIRKHAHVDSNGEQFLAGLFSWSERILRSCDDWFHEYQVAREPFTHPITAASID